ncbi:MAG: hypothetical protein V4796_05190 [Burkholderia cenocepacia]
MGGKDEDLVLVSGFDLNSIKSTARPDRRTERPVKQAYSARLPINLAGAYA